MRRPVACLLMLAACGGDDGTVTKHDAAVDTPVSHVDAPTDSKVFLDGPAGTTPLVIKNYLQWCKIFANGDSVGSTDAVVTVNVTPGVIPIAATAKPGGVFEIAPNMWHHTDGDGGTGETGTISGGSDPRTQTSTVSATVGATSTCVWICCPFYPNGNGCESNVVPEQCP